MRVLLISANTESITMPVLPIGLAAVAAATKLAGHEVHVLDLLGAGEPQTALATAVENFAPEVTGISVRNIDDQNMTSPRFLLQNAKDVVSWCRALSQAPIVVGGSGYSIFPEAALSYLGADMGIQGEGENAFPLLLSRMKKEADLLVPGLYLQGRGNTAERRFERCLDDLPLPDPLLWSSAGHSNAWVPVQTRRGCPMRCSYCSTAGIEGSRMRKRSTTAVIEAISGYVEAGFQQFHFVDNLFNLPPSYALSLCNELAERRLGISWRAIVYPGKLNPELVKAMKKAGCAEVSLGFEAGSDPVLRSMNKSFDTGDIRFASELFHEQGIHRFGFLLLGSPAETRRTAEESLAFADSLDFDGLKITAGIRIYPLTPLADVARREGILGIGDDLLFPRFYLKPGLEDWLRRTIREFSAGRSYCIT